MRFGKSFLDQLDPFTAKLIHRADHMTDVGAEKTARTNAWIKATDHAYAQQQWLAYIGSVYYAMWSMECCEGKYLKRLLQYSNDFIRFGKEHLREVLAGAGRNADWAARTYVNTYTYIYEFYREYYQISDEKIEELFDLYRQEFRAYPGTTTEYHYMFARMHRGTVLRDAKQAAASLRRVEALSKTTYSCYVCKNKDIVGAMLLTGRTDEALHRIAQIISDEGIPESWYDDYRNCENATGSEQYAALIRHAFWLRMSDTLRRFARDYQSEVLSDDEDDVDCGTDFLVLTITRAADTRRTFYLEEAAKALDTLRELTPLMQLQFLLSAWGYFEMLHQNGVETAALSLQKPPIEGQDGVYSTHALAQYLLKKADALGEKFDRARPSFAYHSLRETTLSMLDPAQNPA